MELSVQLLDPKAKVPTTKSVLSPYAEIYTPKAVRLVPGDRRLIPIGIALDVPGGFYGRLTPLLAHALKFGINVLSGVVEAGDHEELKIILQNTGTQNFSLAEGEPICNLILEAILTPNVVHVVDVTKLRTVGNEEENPGY
jgi:dUTP pyrophosphatase